MNHYQIYYLNCNGKETLPNMAAIFGVFANGEFTKDFYQLSTANAWIADQLNRELFPKCAARLDAFEREESEKNLLALAI